jgi:hypothetical protein
LPIQLGQTPSCIKLNIGPSSAGLTSQGWKAATWYEKWQLLDDGSHIFHVFALLEIAKDDDVFFFDECKKNGLRIS